MLSVNMKMLQHLPNGEKDITMINATASVKKTIGVFLILIISLFQSTPGISASGKTSHSTSTCGTPATSIVLGITSSTALISWSSVSGATGYLIRYRISGVSSWSIVSSLTTNKTLTGLSSSSIYQYQISATCPTGQGTYSSVVQFITQTSCSKPYSVTMSSVSATSENISWASIPGIQYYNIRYKPVSTSTWTSDSAISNSKALHGLIPATTYNFQLQTVCSSTGQSAFTTSYTFTTPAAPVNCGVPNVAQFSSTNITTNSCTVGWSYVGSALSYKVQYRKRGTNDPWLIVSSNTNSAVLNGLSSGTLYEFGVQSICSSGSSAFSAVGIFTTSTPSCGTPAGLSSSAITTTGATLSWTAVSGALSYTVRYRVNGTGTWTTANSNITSLVLSSLVAGTVYEFQVLANCSLSIGVYSASAGFTTTAIACSVPNVASFSSTSITYNSAIVGWGTVLGAVGYKVQYRINGSGGAWDALSVVSNSATLSGLASSTQYEFQVQTLCSTGVTAYSASGIFTTTTSSCGAPNVAFFSATSITSSSCVVGWASVSSAISYNVQYRIKSIGGAWNTQSSTSLSSNLVGLVPATQYEFQVQTVCNVANSAFSASGIFTTGGVTSCGVASGFSATGVTASAATLNWNAVSGSTAYNIQYRLIGSGTWSTTSSTINSKMIVGLSASSNYEYQVQTVCNGSTSAFSSSANFTTPATGAATLPVPDHIVVVWFENHAYSQIIGNAAAPHINALAFSQNSALFTESYGIEHPSQPNYLDLFAGGNQGVTSNLLPANHFTSMNLARALINAGRTFVAYSEDLPSVGWDGEFSGGYARKHNPIANWMGTGTNQVPSSLNQPFTSFPTNFSTLPTVCFVAPTLLNSMHDGTGNTAITTGDSWFFANIQAYADWARNNNSLLILTFDEDDNVSGNRIATIFTGSMVAAGQYSAGINHYNVLRTIEDMYGLVHSGAAASATPIHGCWLNGYRMADPERQKAEPLSLYPNPAFDHFTIDYSLEENSNVTISISNIFGQKVYSDTKSEQEPGTYNREISLADLNLSRGIYFVEMLVNEKRFISKLMLSEK